jgi:hypothetical protein
MTPTKPRTLTPRQEASATDTSAQRLKTLAADPKLTRLVAANPSAPAELLLELSHSDDKAVRKACTSNANTPVEALLKLGAQFPEQLLENPVFDLLLLAHPGLFEELPTSTLNSLLKRDQVPVELIRWAWKHRGESTLHSLLMNPNTPVDVVNELCKSKDPEVRMASQLHCARKAPKWASPSFDEDSLIYLENLRPLLIIKDFQDTSRILCKIADLIDGNDAIRLLKYLEEPALLSIACDTTRSELMAVLAQSPSGHVRKTVSENRNAPSYLLDKLALDDEADVAASVACNWNTTMECLSSLSKHQSELVRRCVAQNRVTNPETLEALSRDESVTVRMSVGSNGRTSAKVLAQLAVDSSIKVRSCVAANNQIEADLVILLIKDPEPGVRSSLAENSRLSVDAQLELAKDIDSDVRSCLIGNKALSKECLAILSVDTDNSIRQRIARDLELPTHIVAALCRDEDPDVRRLVASKSEEAVSILINDPIECVRSAAASSDKAGFKDLRAFAKDNSVEVRVCAARNPRMPPDCLAILADDWDYSYEMNEFVAMAVASNPRTPEDVLLRLSRDETEMTRCRVAGNPGASSDVLETLVADPDELVRLCLITSHLPLKMLKKLAEDPSEKVRRRAGLYLDNHNKRAFISRTDKLRPDHGFDDSCCEAQDGLSESSLPFIAVGIKRLCAATNPSASRRFLFTLPQCPASVLAKNFRSRSWLERFAIAGNPSTPESVLQRMAQEGNQLVRRAARANLEARRQRDTGTTSAQNEANQP